MLSRGSVEIVPVRAPCACRADRRGTPSTTRSGARSSSISHTPHAWLSPDFDQRLGELAEEAFDVGLAHEEIERELNGAGLNLHHALGVTPLRGFANERGAKHIRIG